MKRAALIILAVTSMLTIACATPNGEAKEPPRFTAPDHGSVEVITDTQTGYKYLHTYSGNRDNQTSGLTPLLSAAGQPICGR